MNARKTGDVKPESDLLVFLLDHPREERTMPRISSVLLTNFVTTMSFAGHALASQGPGTTPGTASASLQWAMAITVYGVCAAAIAAGAIGTFRKNRIQPRQ